MSCYHPMLAGRLHPEDNWKLVGSVPDMKFAKKQWPYTIKVPCGQCIGCRLDKSREWADRMLLEYDHTKKACFVTLTFRSEEKAIELGIDPELSIRDNLCLEDEDKRVYTLLKSDIQKFMKDLRGRKKFEDTEIRFFACGEYGTNYSRPHYHLIIFGVDINDFGPLEVVGSNEFGDLYYRSPVLEDLWKKGISSISETSWKTFAYVARYVTKKMTGPGKVVYENNNRFPEFALMSRRPGISGYYLIDHDFDFDKSKIFINDTKEGKQISVPKYFLKKLELIDPEKYNEIKEKRRNFANDRELLHLMQTDLGIEGITDIERERLEKRIVSLKRRLETEENLY